MRSSVDKDKKMVTNIKKRKSSISQTEPKAKSPKKEPGAGSPGSSAKGKAKPIKAQTPKAKTPAVPRKQIKAEPASPTATQSKPTLRKRGKQNGNENAIQSKFEKKTVVKKVLKKNIKPVLVKQEKLTIQNDTKKKQPAKQVKALPQKVKQEKTQKPLKEKAGLPKAAPSRRRAMMKEKFNDLRERVRRGDIAAINEVEEVMKKIVDRGEFSRSSKRKLRAYRTLLHKAGNAPAVKPQKGKKTAKKNK